MGTVLKGMALAIVSIAVVGLMTIAGFVMAALSAIAGYVLLCVLAVVITMCALQEIFSKWRRGHKPPAR